MADLFERILGQEDIVKLSNDALETKIKEESTVPQELLRSVRVDHNMTQFIPPQYHERFLEEGFSTWSQVLDITEADLDALGVRLRDCRRIQSAIANFKDDINRDWVPVPVDASREEGSNPYEKSKDRDGSIPAERRSKAQNRAAQRAFRERQAGHAKDSEKRLAELERTSTSLSEETESLKREVANLSNENEVAKSSSAQSSGNVNRTRKWRRHPRPDDHAPDRPPSAYVIFSNIVREELKDQDLSFTKIARTVGERWQALTSDQRRPFEDQACGAKERYLEELANYKETEEYKDYQKYLWDFNARFSTNTASKTSASSILVEETSGSTIYSVPGAPTPRISAMSISACPSLVEDSSDKSWSTRSSASESSPRQPSALPPGFKTLSIGHQSLSWDEFSSLRFLKRIKFAEIGPQWRQTVEVDIKSLRELLEIGIRVEGNTWIYRSS